MLHAAAGGGRHRDGLVRPDRQRARRVRDRDAPQQPARPAARPAGAQHDPGSRGRHSAAQRRAPPDPRRDQRRPAGALHQLGGLRSAPQAPRVADQLRGCLRHPPDDPRLRPRRASLGNGRRRHHASPPSGQRPGRSSTRPAGRPASRPTLPTSCSATAPGPTTPTASRPRAWTRSTSGSAASPRSPTCSAACSARRSTTCSRTSSRSCRTATGSTTWPARPA